MKKVCLFTLIMSLFVVSQIFAAGSSQSTNDIWVTIQDQNGNPLSDVVVTLKSLKTKQPGNLQTKLNRLKGKNVTNEINKSVVTQDNGKAIFNIDTLHYEATITLHIVAQDGSYDQHETVDIPNKDHNEITIRIIQSQENHFRVNMVN